jgi:hypothetical protein
VKEIGLQERGKANKPKGGKNYGSDNLPKRAIQEKGLIGHD